MLFAVLIQVFGFYGLYHTSERVILATGRLSYFLHRRKKFVKILSWTLMVFSFLIYTNFMGFGAGVLTGFILWMATGSVIILIYPLIENSGKNAGQ